MCGKNRAFFVAAYRCLYCSSMCKMLILKSDESFVGVFFYVKICWSQSHKLVERLFAFYFPLSIRCKIEICCWKRSKGAASMWSLARYRRIQTNSFDGADCWKGRYSARRNGDNILEESVAWKNVIFALDQRRGDVSYNCSCGWNTSC